MKQRLWILVLTALLLAGCVLEHPEDPEMQTTKESSQTQQTLESQEAASVVTENFTHVEPVGTVPPEFQKIVEEDLFRNVVAFPDRLLSSESATQTEKTIRMYDFSGNLLQEQTVTLPSENHVLSSLTATSDGGFLYVQGFQDRYLDEDHVWASERGVASTIVKYSPGGTVEWELYLENYDGHMLDTCIELEDGYYFFGEQETPETDVIGAASPTDIHITKVEKSGTVLQTGAIGGSDFDFLNLVYPAGDSFILYCETQSSDGDFPSGGLWRLEMDSALNITEQIPFTSDACLILGYLDGEPVLNDQKIFDGYDYFHFPTALLDYGDFYLIVSENKTGLWEDKPPEVSSALYYTETVYSAFDKDGSLLWRASVDSSPDY